MVLGSRLASLAGLGLLVTGISAAVLPRSQQPCPHYEPEGELLDEYIVEFHNDHTLEDHFKTIGKDLRHEPDVHRFGYLDMLHMYRAALSEEFVHNFVRYDPGVKSVERSVTVDLAHSINDTEVAEPVELESQGLAKRFVPKWAFDERKGPHHLQQLAAGNKISLSNQDEKYKVLHGAGEGVDVYVLDSGIRITHKFFGGRASHFSQSLGHSPYTLSDSPLDDTDGHGTHVAGLVGASYAGVAPWSNLVSVKVGCYQGGCKGHTGGIVEAINAVTKRHNENKANKPDKWKGSVINMSFVATAKSNVLNKAIDRAYDAGIPFAVAGGNKPADDKTKATGTLCESQNTICVGGVDKDYNKGWFSRDGKFIDIWAPGSEIVSLALDGRTMMRTGSSMSSGQVAGIMALIVGYEGISDNARLVYDRLKANQLSGVVGKLSNPWFFGEKENNFFAQTGAGSRNVNEQPYTGPSKDLDRLIAPIDVFRKRQESELQVDVGNGQAIKFPESDFWKTTEVIDENPNDDIAAVAVQEFKLDTSNPGVDTEPAQAEFEDDSAPEEEPSSDSPSDSPIEQDTVNGKPVCQGNQVFGDCVAGKLPNRGDFAGQYGPVCVKADGEQGSKPRLNEQELNKAAATYCQNLIDKRWLFKEGAPNPSPMVATGVAENGASMALSIMYHKPGCPEDKSMSENDFGNMKLEDCVTYLSQSFSVTCGIGATWANYNKDFQVMGGVLAKDCLMWTVYGQ
ncbi:unnamed protein product [Fusarium graminearum]|uniref:Peptidase S8/S53 domain-containing protein n=1 Tax=Gibberella zeae TaxID=5518 RepID=A0A4U9F8H8_GIBZA|nr:unnamed protein product [Fusarium graminearum]VTO92529.1 unnamed protein product [Fusarium graminearum]